MIRPGPLGRTTWVFAGGHVPADSTGHEPEFTSRDELCLLNTGRRDAHIELTIYHPDQDPVGPYALPVAAQRVRHVRINDLIDPEAIPLGRPYGAVIVSDVPVAAQLTRTDTRRDAMAIAMVTGIPGDAGGPIG